MEEIVSPGNTVAHMAAIILIYMGAGTIILIGQDLAFPGKQHHAKEHLEGQVTYSEEDMDAYLEKVTEMVEDINGNMVETTKVFKIAIEQFSSIARVYNDNVKFVDATEGGAKIEHTEIMTLRDAIDTYMAEFTDSSFTAEAINTAKENGELFDKYEKLRVKSTFEKMLRQYKNIDKVADDAIKEAKKISKLFERNKIPTEKELEKPVDRYYALLEKFNENGLAISSTSPAWDAYEEETEATRRDDEHRAHFFVRLTSPIIALQKRISEEMKQALEKTIAEIKADDI
jgi:hypothetical protein